MLVTARYRLPLLLGGLAGEDLKDLEDLQANIYHRVPGDLGSLIMLHIFGSRNQKGIDCTCVSL